MKIKSENGNSWMPRTPLRLILVLGFFSMVLLPSCSYTQSFFLHTRSLFGGEFDMEINIAKKANDNSPIAVDLVLVYDENLVKEILGISAKEWFKTRREEFKRDPILDTKFDTWGWEWTPGQSVLPKEFPIKANAKAGIIFANYIAKGTHRVRVIPNKSLKIHLEEKGFEVKMGGSH